MYAVCDLSLGLVMTKTANFVLKDFPAEPVLPAKLFTQPDQNYSNTKNYLPKELQISQLKVCCLIYSYILHSSSCPPSQLLKIMHFNIFPDAFLIS